MPISSRPSSESERAEGGSECRSVSASGAELASEAGGASENASGREDLEDSGGWEAGELVVPGSLPRFSSKGYRALLSFTALWHRSQPSSSPAARAGRPRSPAAHAGRAQFLPF